MDGEFKLEDQESIMKYIKVFFFVFNYLLFIYLFKLYTKEVWNSQYLDHPAFASFRKESVTWLEELFRNRKLELLFLIWVVTRCQVRMVFL